MSAGSHRARGAAGGYTLVETLVALAALSLLAGAGIWVTDFAVRTQDTLELRNSETRDILRLRSILRSDLSQAAPRRPRSDTGNKPQRALLTRREETPGPNTFLALVRRGWDNPLLGDRPDLQYVEYALRENRIERTYRRNIDGAPLEPPQVLIDGVESVDLEFFHTDQWAPGWPGSPANPLPRALRLDIEMRNGGAISQAFLLPEFGS